MEAGLYYWLLLSENMMDRLHRKHEYNVMAFVSNCSMSRRGRKCMWKQYLC